MKDLLSAHRWPLFSQASCDFSNQNNESAGETPVTAISLHQQLNDVETLGRELKRLLVRHESAIEEEGVREDLEMLERWMESYRRGLAAACKIADNGTACLSELRERLAQAADDLQRLENEGGNTAPNPAEARKTEELLKASNRIDQIIPNVGHLFNDTSGDALNHAKKAIS